MTVYHVVLFKLKPATPSVKLTELKNLLQGMVGQISGLQRVDFGPPHPSTAHRSKGFDAGVVAILDKPEDLKGYAEHPSHLKVHALRESICDDTIVYDLEF